MKFVTQVIRLSILLIMSHALVQAQVLNASSPNRKINVRLLQRAGKSTNELYLQVIYKSGKQEVEAIPEIALGLTRSDQDFSKSLKILHISKPKLIKEKYAALHGKKSVCENSAYEIKVSLENSSKSKINVIVRAYNDGVAFRYEFPGKQGTFQILDEQTTYTIPRETKRWMEKWNPANEGLYTAMSAEKVQKQEWSYPALFQTKDTNCWFLLHEADLDDSYCGTKLNNLQDSDRYKLSFPNPRDGRGQGASNPTITLPWVSPWRVVLMGALPDVVASTLVDDVSAPSIVKETGWIKPGLVSWNYWSSNHGTKDFKTVKAFADLAAEMNWPYTLLDWEWDAMTNGGNVEDAAKYILSKGVKPLIWYNSGGNHTWVAATPKDRMLTHENRKVEFAKLKKMGFAGVKIDFFESEKQDMIRYYLDILKDAAAYQMMVYFHGCLVPRGWSRTYPHLMTYEAVRGAEWYNNGPEFTMTAPEHNTILPFTRNVVGPMDYTPVTFTNSQFPHTTSYGHELALSVVFESGFQHLADRPDGYHDLPDAAKTFLKKVPNAWDETRLIDGYPGKYVIIARRKGTAWYVGAINAENREMNQTVHLPFLQSESNYSCTLITDGEHDKSFKTQFSKVNHSSTLAVKILRRGGFVAVFTPDSN
ncbi:glycoside hydrolase family 97 catalytic domain-containing protein [Mucilaginibacter sp. PAMB04168]|uniref:glycoside hydrolase family 97 protein n=1 Tax=Mucilaginibacter sp. PAMB04168 TaxID=3138567 RepID=UPI0031F6F8C8